MPEILKPSIEMPGVPVSLIAHIFSGLFMFISVIFILMNYSKLRSNVYVFAILLILLAITMSLHGLSHLGLEAVYGYNPISLLVQ
jgi:hypothetical protein